MRAWYDALLAVVFAPDCAACARPLDTPSRGPICEPCWSSIAPLPPDEHNLTSGGRPLIAKFAAAGEYDAVLRAAVHALKYRGRRTLAVRLSALMRERGATVLNGADLVVPVPLHPARRRHRGFNQARDLAKHLGLPLVTAIRRVRPTLDQITLTMDARRDNVDGAFAVTHRRTGVAGRIVVLVDDVATTGATLEACARALSAAGAREVRALTAARARRERP